jgi:predicted DNA binding CopG/RHH family protein
MKTPVVKASPRKSRRIPEDRQVTEFQRRDLGGDIPATARVLRKSRPTSIVLEPDLVDRLRAAGAKRGLGYQTMLKVIVREHLDEY